MSNYDLPPITPDDFSVVASFAKALYQDTKNLEAVTKDNPVPNEQLGSDSYKIQKELESAKRQALATLMAERARAAQHMPPPQPQPAPPPFTSPQFTYVEPQQPIIDTHQPTPTYISDMPPRQEDTNQLELNFNPSKADEVVRLLESINKNLIKLLTCLDKNEKCVILG